MFLEISPMLQEERIKMRNSSESAKGFFEKWIPMENTYHKMMSVKERCEFVISIN